MMGEIVIKLKEGLLSLKDIFFPRRCIVCKDFLRIDEKYLCHKCLDDLPLTYTWCYANNFLERRFLNKGIDVQGASSLFFYRPEGYSDVIKQFKYEGNISLGKSFADSLAKSLLATTFYSQVQGVVAVPLHPLKRFQRGFNQAEVIAMQVANSLKVPQIKGLISKKKYTATQTKFGYMRRGENVAGSFKINHQKMLSLKAAGITHLLVVDDVLTTGATLTAIIEPLVKNDFTIYIATLACVEE